MKKYVVLLFVLITVSVLYPQTDTISALFPVKIASADVYAADSAFTPPKSMTNVYPPRPGRGQFSHIVYHVKITFMLEMGKEWVKPFWVMTESPEGKRDAFLLNKEEYYLPDHNFFYYNIDIASLKGGFARIWIGEDKGNSDFFYFPGLSTTFYLN